MNFQCHQNKIYPPDHDLEHLTFPSDFLQWSAPSPHFSPSGVLSALCQLVTGFHRCMSSCCAPSPDFHMAAFSALRVKLKGHLLEKPSPSILYTLATQATLNPTFLFSFFSSVVSAVIYLLPYSLPCFSLLEC